MRSARQQLQQHIKSLVRQLHYQPNRPLGPAGKDKEDQKTFYATRQAQAQAPAEDSSHWLHCPRPPPVLWPPRARRAALVTLPF